MDEHHQMTGAGLRREIAHVERIIVKLKTRSRTSREDARLRRLRQRASRLRYEMREAARSAGKR